MNNGYLESSSDACATSDAPSAVVAWVADYDTARPHCSLRYATRVDVARTIAASGPDPAPDDSSA